MSDHVPNFVVIGDVIIDRYTHGKKKGVSAETPTIVAYHEKEEMFVGGAGLVARHILRLGGIVRLLTTTGTFGYEQLCTAFEKSNDPLTTGERSRLELNCHALPDMIIPEKHRMYVEDYKMLQYDRVNQRVQNNFEERRFFLKFVDLVKPETDGVIICDNRHGTMTKYIAKEVIKHCTKKKVTTYLDSQVSQSESNHLDYDGADVVFLNMKEFADAFKSSEANVSDFFDTMILKRGAEGAMLFRDGKFVSEAKGIKVETVDTCGAGDAFLAAYVMNEDMKFANRWAALSTTFKGTIVPKMADLRRIKE